MTGSDRVRTRNRFPHWNSFLLETANRDQIYHFIHLTLRLFSRNTSENVIDYLEYIANISEINKLL